MKKPEKTASETIRGQSAHHFLLSKYSLMAILAIILVATILFFISRESSSTQRRGENQPTPHAGMPASNSAAPTEAMRVNQTPAPGNAPDRMVWIAGGTFQMGCDDCDMPDAMPVHTVTTDGY